MNTTSNIFETVLNRHIFDYANRQAQAWHRSYISPKAYIASVHRNRSRWKKTINDEAIDIKVDGYNTAAESDGQHTISLKIDGDLEYQALFKEPIDKIKSAYPLIVCLHGIDGSPDIVLGIDGRLRSNYHNFGRVLSERGYAVLIPALINNFASRAKVNRMALLLGTNIWGLEIQLIRTLLGLTIKKFPVDPDRIGVWGISMGGAYALYTMPIEERFSVGIISAWFNHRLTKMIVEDKRYSCFLSSEEEHAFLPGLLTEFTDSDLVSLICPRPLLIQTGEHDPVSDTALVREEIAATRVHYHKLKLHERFNWHAHQGGHEIDLENGLSFLDNWL